MSQTWKRCADQLPTEINDYLVAWPAQQLPSDTEPPCYIKQVSAFAPGFGWLDVNQPTHWCELIADPE